jgi:S1-C subfamily serine protease
MLALMALIAVTSLAMAQPRPPGPECVLPRNNNYSPLDDAPILTDRLGEPEVFDCLLTTAEKGTSRYALEWSQILLWEGKIDGTGYGSSGTVGGLFPRSESRLKKYIDIGVQLGSHHSMLAKAAYLQDIDPTTAIELYRRVATEDDCRGQAMIGWMYQQGVGVGINEAAAYFWGRLAARDSKGHNPYTNENQWGGDNLLRLRPVPYFEQRAFSVKSGNPHVEWEKKQYCADMKGIVDLERLASAPYAEDVHDLLLKWRAGQDQPDSLARYAGYQHRRQARPEKGLSAVSKPESEFAGRVTWRPVTVNFAPVSNRVRPIPSLYDELSKSVYIVVAAPSTADLRARKNMAQGSAVAVDFRTLITNCHIVEGRSMVYVATRNGPSPLRVSSARVGSDTCVLVAESDQFAPVARVRSFDSLQVGEIVLAIGAPSGFSNTLSTGIVSQLRVLEGRKLVQTTAAISGGSSGGGLFDEKGNLIGITTFAIRDADSLNFAVSIDEYLRP